MLEVRFHGRGGGGAVVMATMLAKAFFHAGFHVQSFPFFGVERRGAPVEAYLRLDKKKILARTGVTTPDHVVVLDQSLMQNIDVTKGLKPGGWILLNGPSLPEDARRLAPYKIATVDSTRIALNNGIGTRTHPIVNTAMIGAFARIMESPPMEAVTDTIRRELTSNPERNVSAAEEAYRDTVLQKSTA
jgi:pyruvate ferredoxin oxidoreductase gamma subunit/2-oxoisovalerate ferredoxin oxidoreductase gamma subunit